jgi:hypothetical protein
MTPEPPAFMNPENNPLIAAFERGYLRGLLDAAKIAEGTSWHMDRPHAPIERLVADQIGAAIRARITPRSTTPTDDHSKE